MARFVRVRDSEYSTRCMFRGSGAVRTQECPGRQPEQGAHGMEDVVFLEEG